MSLGEGRSYKRVNCGIGVDSTRSALLYLGMRFWLTLIALLFLLVFALRKGGEPERFVVISLAIAFLAFLGVNELRGPYDFLAMDFVNSGIEAALFVALFLIALRANRWWTLFACALQLIILVAHLNRALGVQATPEVYWGMTSLPSYLQLLCIALGVFAHDRRTRRMGRYPDWRSR